MHTSFGVSPRRERACSSCKIVNLDKLRSRVSGKGTLAALSVCTGVVSNENARTLQKALELRIVLLCAGDKKQQHLCPFRISDRGLKGAFLISKND